MLAVSQAGQRRVVAATVVPQRRHSWNVSAEVSMYCRLSSIALWHEVGAVGHEQAAGGRGQVGM
jgi:hypothetical protein